MISQIKSCHKRTVGQEHSDVLGQVHPVHNRFVVLQTDTQTQDLDSIGEACSDNSSLQNSQLSKHIHQSISMDTGLKILTLLGTFNIVLVIPRIIERFSVTFWPSKPYTQTYFRQH